MSFNARPSLYSDNFSIVTTARVLWHQNEVLFVFPDRFSPVSVRVPWTFYPSLLREPRAHAQLLADIARLCGGNWEWASPFVAFGVPEDCPLLPLPKSVLSVGVPLVGDVPSGS